MAQKAYTKAMLLPGSRLIGTPIMSLQTGARLAVIERPLIDPSNLHIVAYEVAGPLLTEQPAFIRTTDVREYGNLGMIVDSSDELIGLDDVIRIKELYDLAFKLIDLAVIDDHGQKLGKVEDYTMETDHFLIQQLSVKRGFFKSFTDTGLLINRSQILEINNSAIIVRSPTVKAVEPVMQAIRGEFVNPFRKPSSQPEPEARSN